jgi:ATP-dependent Lon protease
MPTIGLFPLAMVLLPGERTALHIFEPRYKELIGKCLAEDREFGIVLIDMAGTRSVGTRASVVEVLERFDDGRLNVVVEGNDRFQIIAIKDELSYLTAEIDEFPDEVGLPDNEEYELCLADYRRVVADAGLDLEEPSPDYRGLAFHIASQIELSPDAKQGILEMRSEKARLDLVRQLLDAAAKALRLRTVEQRAATNGHVDWPKSIGP